MPSTTVYKYTFFLLQAGREKREFSGVHVEHFPTSTTAAACEFSIHFTSIHTINDTEPPTASPMVWFNIYQMRSAITNCILSKCHMPACPLLEDLLYKYCPGTTLQASHTTNMWCYELSCHRVPVAQVYCTRSQCFKQIQQHPLSRL